MTFVCGVAFCVGRVEAICNLQCILLQIILAASSVNPFVLSHQLETKHKIIQTSQLIFNV